VPVRVEVDDRLELCRHGSLDAFFPPFGADRHADITRPSGERGQRQVGASDLLLGDFVALGIAEHISEGGRVGDTNTQAVERDAAVGRTGQR
jgi:hypothetical protein